MICGIVTGGAYSTLTDIEECDYVIACDLGYQYCLDQNIKVDLLIGDFDSYHGQLPADVEKIILPVQKDDTDTMAAYRKVVESGFDTVYLYCSQGKRFDHGFANIQTAHFGASHGVTTVMKDENELIIVTSQSETALAKKEGYSLAVFALTTCQGVSIKGAKYEVENITITPDFPIGQSNGWVSDEVVIQVAKGIYMIVCSKL